MSLCLHSGLDRTRGFGSGSRGLVLGGLKYFHDVWADSNGTAALSARPLLALCHVSHIPKPIVTAERHTSSHGAPVPSTRSDTGSNRHSHYPGVVPGNGAPAGMDDRSMMTIGEESDDVELRLAIEASRAV